MWKMTNAAGAPMETTKLSNALTTKRLKQNSAIRSCCVAVSCSQKRKFPLHVTVNWLFTFFGRHLCWTVRNFWATFFSVSFFLVYGLAACTFHWVARYLVVRDSISSLLSRTQCSSVSDWKHSWYWWELIQLRTHTHTPADATSLNSVTEPLIANYIIIFSWIDEAEVMLGFFCICLMWISIENRIGEFFGRQFKRDSRA